MSEVKKQRSDLHADASKWLASALPGVFANERDQRLPCMDLIVTNVASPGNPTTDSSSCLAALEVDDVYDSWRCTQLPGLTLHLRKNHSLWKRGNWGEITLAGNYSTILPDEVFQQFTEGRSIETIVNCLAMYDIQNILARFALNSLLGVKEVANGQARDLARRTHGRRSVRSNAKLRDSLLSSSVDVSSVAVEIVALASSGPAALTFEAFGEHRALLERRQDAVVLWESITAWQIEKAKALHSSDEQLRGILVAVAGISATIENIRLQRLTFIATAVSVLIAVLALAVALSTRDANQFFENIRSWWENVRSWWPF